MNVFSTNATLLTVMVASTLALSACDNHGDTRASGDDINIDLSIDGPAPTVDEKFDTPSKPADKPSKPADKPSKPADKPSKPADKPSKPADKP